MEFNKEEIALAKELHELGVKRRRKCGDWVYVEYPPKYANPPRTTGQVALYERLQHSTIPFKIKFDLWQIHECLEWLRGKGCDRIEIKVFWNELQVEIRHESKLEFPKYKRAKTLLEALLKAMIAIKKEEE